MLWVTSFIPRRSRPRSIDWRGPVLYCSANCANLRLCRHLPSVVLKTGWLIQQATNSSRAQQRFSRPSQLAKIPRAHMTAYDGSNKRPTHAHTHIIVENADTHWLTFSYKYTQANVRHQVKQDTSYSLTRLEHCA
jgi:hypothetical protein